MKALETWYLLSVLLMSGFSLQALADEGTVELVYPQSQNGPIIPIKWDGDTFQIQAKAKREEAKEGQSDSKAQSADKEMLEAELLGKFLVSDWSLLFVSDQLGSQTVIKDSKKDQSFVLHVPIQGEKTHVTLVAVEPDGNVKKDEFDLVYNKWNIDPKQVPCASIFCLKSFQIGALSISNVTGVGSATMLAWTPSFEKRTFRIRANLGAMPVQGLTGSWSAAVDYGFAVSVKVIGPFWIEAFGGMQFWFDHFTHAPIVGGNVVYRLRRRILSCLEQFSVGAGGFLPSGNPTLEVKAGVGLSF